ncbi:MAG: DUF4920 domain-containing protein [Deltaproteobacteria bacterium]|nr:DUF4920 domain-containing protein [Deltaproteobacteria bacterium]
MRKLSTACLPLFVLAASLAFGCAKAEPPAAAPAAPALAPAAPSAAPTPAAAAPAGATSTAAPACGHGDNPACATNIDPKLAAEHGPELALAGDKFGQGVTLSETVSIDALLANPDAYAGKRVRVEGEVEDVCRMRGCWFAMKGEKPGQTMKFKVTDGVMTFPVSAIGKWAVAEGQVRKMPLTLEQTIKVKEHEALEQGQAFDPASVKEAMTLVRLDGLGAVIRDKK